MLGYYSDFSGDIKFDGNSMKNLNIEQLNKMISIIHQNVYMFDKTIKIISAYIKNSQKNK